MTKSLQEQLLALGLAKTEPKPNPKARPTVESKRNAKSNSKPAEARHPPRPSPKVARSPLEPSLEEAYRIRDQQAKAQEEKARELKRLHDLERRRINNEVRAIVDAHRLNDTAADLARNFVYKGRIRKIHVNAQQLAELNEGKLGVVYLAGGYHLLESAFVDQVRALSADHVPDFSTAAPDDQDGEHPVPDDLVW